MLLILLFSDFVYFFVYIFSLYERMGILKQPFQFKPDRFTQSEEIEMYVMVWYLIALAKDRQIIL